MDDNITLDSLVDKTLRNLDRAIGTDAMEAQQLVSVLHSLESIAQSRAYFAREEQREDERNN